MIVRKPTKAELAKKAAAVKARLAKVAKAHEAVVEAAKQAQLEHQRAEEEAAELAEGLALHEQPATREEVKADDTRFLDQAPPRSFWQRLKDEW